MLQKRFDQWNVRKKLIENSEAGKVFNERDILFLSVGENIGFEQGGKGDDFLRPILVFRKFSSRLFFGVPLTKSQKEGPFYFSFKFRNVQSTAILSQLRLFDSKRVKYFYGKLGSTSFLELKKRLIELLQ